MTPLRYINIYTSLFDHYLSSGDHLHGDFRNIADADDLYERQRELTHATCHEWFAHGDDDYPQWDTLGPSKGADEGIINYFAVRVARESGNWSAERVNDEWMSMYHAYTTTLLGTPNDVPIVDSDFITGEAQYVLAYKKAALVHHLLDYQVGQVSGGTKSIEDVYRFLHSHVTNTESYCLGIDKFLLTYDLVLGRDFRSLVNLMEDVAPMVAYNLVTSHDFGSFFAAYMAGTEPLPFVVISDTLQINDAALPETPQLDSLSLVRLAMPAYLALTLTVTVSSTGSRQTSEQTQPMTTVIMMA